MSYTVLNGGVAYVTGEAFGYRDAVLIQSNLEDHEDRIVDLEGAVGSARGMFTADLGGAKSRGTRSAAFVEVEESRHPKIDGSNLGSLTTKAVVEYRTTDTGTSVDWQVIDLDNASAVVASGTVYSGSTAWQTEEQTITLNASAHRYELQVKGGNANADVFAVGRIDIYQ